LPLIVGGRRQLFWEFYGGIELILRRRSIFNSLGKDFKLIQWIPVVIEKSESKFDLYNQNHLWHDNSARSAISCH
jgi:hypothetical protein